MSFNPEDVDEPFGVGELNIDGVDHEVPFLRCGFNDCEIVLHWGNSLLRAFYFNEEMNHVEYRDEEKKLKGIRMDQELMDLMQVYGWPMRVDPIPDEQTSEWFVQMEMRSLESELDDLDEL